MDNELSMDQEFLEKLNNLIELNLENENFGVEELAEAIGKSRSQLHRKLNAINGKSTSQFIREYRLEKAMKMLQNNVATASEIAYRVGFGSPSYFNTCFHDFYGYTPGEVKFRNPLNDESNGEIQSLNDNTETVTIKRKLYNLRTYIIGALAIILIVSFTYYNYAISNVPGISKNENLESVEISIAVLPFKNMSGNSENEAFCDGMTTAIISRLSKIKGISKVISLTSMMNYKDNKKTIQEIAKELNVHYILESGFQKSGDNFKINLQLINGPNDNQLWSDEYSGKWNINEIFMIQSEVAENVAINMDVKVSDIEMKTIHKSPTNNNEAYNLFLLAHYQMSKGNEVAFRNAIPLYERAIALDSSFIDAYSGLADIWTLGGLIWGIFDEKIAWKKSKELLQSAVKLDNTNISVMDQLHIGYFYYDWDFKSVESYLKSRNDLPNFDKFKYFDFSDYLIKTGGYNQVLVNSNENIKMNPVESWSYISKAISLFYLNRKTESHEVITNYASLFIDDLDYLREASKLYFYLGDYQNSKKQLNLIMNNFSDRPPIVIWLNAVLANIDGNEEKSKKNMNQLLQLYDNNTSGSPAWFIALYYCHIKDYEKVFIWLQKSYDRHEVEMTWLKEEPLLIPLRNDSRYKKLLKKIGFLDIK